MLSSDALSRLFFLCSLGFLYVGGVAVNHISSGLEKDIDDSMFCADSDGETIVSHRALMGQQPPGTTNAIKQDISDPFVELHGGFVKINTDLGAVKSGLNEVKTGFDEISSGIADIRNVLER